MKLSELLTCSDTELQKHIDHIDYACNGIALLNSLIEYQKTLDSTDKRNRSAVTGYVLQKLCDLNGLNCDDIYHNAYDNLIQERKR